MTELQQLVYNDIKANPNTYARDIGKRLNKADVCNELKGLRKKNLVTRSGMGKFTTYKIIEND